LAGTVHTETIGNGSATSFTVTHNLGTRDVVVVVRNAASPYEVIDVRWEATTAATVTLDFSAAPSANSVRVGVYSAVAGDSINIGSINDLGDVTISSVADGDFLRWNGTAWINDAVDLSTDTVGSYVQSLVAGTGVTLSNNSGEGATPTITVDTTVIQARVADVSDTEIGYLNGVTSAIQTQFDAKAPLASPTFTGTVTVPDNSFALGTKTTGDYVQSLVAGTGVTLTNNSGESATPTIAIGQAVATNSNVTFADVSATGNLVVTGNLTVNGTTTTLNTETLAVEDNIVVLNSGYTGNEPTANAGIEINRGGGSAANVAIRWNETTDKWQFTNDGSTYVNLSDVTAAAIITAAGGDGTAGQALTTNGAGVLDFTTIVGTTEASIISAVGADGSNGAILTTDGAGNLTFSSSASLDSVASGVITLDGVGELNTSTQSVTANTILTVDSFAKATYRTAKYLVQVTQGTKYTTSEVLLVHDGTTSYMSEYAVIELGASRIPMTVSTSVSGDDVLLRVTITDAATTNATVKVARTLIAV